MSVGEHNCPTEKVVRTLWLKSSLPRSLGIFNNYTGSGPCIYILSEQPGEAVILSVTSQGVGSVSLRAHMASTKTTGHVLS